MSHQIVAEAVTYTTTQQIQRRKFKTSAVPEPTTLAIKMPQNYRTHGHRVQP